MNIVTNRFRTFLKQKIARFSILSLVFYCFANFLCISLFLRRMYFIVFLFGIVHITVILTKIKANNTLLEPKMEF